MTRMWQNATTAVLGRVNAEGFMGYWPSVAEDENADPRDRGYAKWLVDTEKVVLANLVDRLHLLLVPEIAGGGQRLFEDGLPASTWTLTHQETGELGEIALVYDRAR